MRNSPHTRESNLQRSATRLASVGHAWRGLGVLLAEPNARIHLGAACAVLLLGLALQVTPQQWALLALSCALVLSAEALNTALEHVVDIASPEWSEGARRAKDVAAAGVLIASIGAVVVGLIVFGPRLWCLAMTCR